MERLWDCRVLASELVQLLASSSEIRACRCDFISRSLTTMVGADRNSTELLLQLEIGTLNAYVS
jgi:hypothetical protein